MKCPCCRELLSVFEFGEDAPFCWDCGLYGADDPMLCDDETHPRRTRDMLCVEGLGWPQAREAAG